MMIESTLVQYTFETKGLAMHAAWAWHLVALESPDGKWIVVSHVNAAKLVARGYKVVHRG